MKKTEAPNGENSMQKTAEDFGIEPSRGDGTGKSPGKKKKKSKRKSLIAP